MLYSIIILALVIGPAQLAISSEAIDTVVERLDEQSQAGLGISLLAKAYFVSYEGKVVSNKYASATGIAKYLAELKKAG